MRRELPLNALICSILLWLAGCGGGSNSGSGTQPAQTASGVTVSPSTATVSRGGTQQFTASVSGATDQTVFWEVNGVQGGNATNGLISETGEYIAPTTLPSSTSITISAIPFSNPAISGTAGVTLQNGSNVAVSISGSGSPFLVQTFGSRTFTATVTGSSNTGVSWQVNGVSGGSAQTGTISTVGIFSAPNSVPVSRAANSDGQTVAVIVTAVSNADSTASDSAEVVIYPPQQNAQSLPTSLGSSGGNANDSSTVSGQTFCCGGTLGSLVSRSGNNYILSNNHVLARTDLGSVGEGIIQPGLVDNNCSTSGANTVANLSQFFNLENGGSPMVDAALAQVVSGDVNTAGTILQLGGTNNGNTPTDGAPHAGAGVTASISQGVAKSGRSTGITCAAVLATNVSTSVQYQKGCGTGNTFSVTYSNQVSVDNSSGFSAEGDSGSLLVTQNNADPVGLLFAASDEDTVANPVADVLKQMADPNTAVQPVWVGSATTHSVAACSLPGAQAARSALQRAANPQALQAATTLLGAHGPELLGPPSVQAVGVGASYDNPSEAAILFFVTKGQPHSGIPAQVDGVRTRIIEGELFAKRGLLSAADSAELEASVPAPQNVHPISDAELARAQSVHTAHVGALMKESGVQGVGISSSVDSPGEAALMIFLIRGATHPAIPPVIDGLRTRLRESSRFRAGFGKNGLGGAGCGVPAAKTAKSLFLPPTQSLR
jgi:hypothetical protein